MSKIQLREYFLHELKRALREENTNQVSLMREVIKNIKLHQIEVKDYADDNSVIQILENLKQKKQEELNCLQFYLDKD